ncbi:MAG: hypothetical protein WDN08_08260 [Rhizomicrobium sp.]
MKKTCILLAGFLAATPALAAETPAPSICIDPHKDYQALYLSGHDIVAKQTLGKDHRELKLTISCLDLRPEDYFSLSSQFACIGLGDTVIANKIGAGHQACRITHVEPYVAPAAAPAPG